MKLIGRVGVGLGILLLAWGIGPWRNTASEKLVPEHSLEKALSAPPRTEPKARPAATVSSPGSGSDVHSDASGDASSVAVQHELALAELDDGALATLIDGLRAEAQSSADELGALRDRRGAATSAGDDDEADRLFARMMNVTERRQAAVAELTRASFEQTCRALDDCDGDARSAFFEAAR